MRTNSMGGLLRKGSPRSPCERRQRALHAEATGERTAGSRPGERAHSSARRERLHHRGRSAQSAPLFALHADLTNVRRHRSADGGGPVISAMGVTGSKPSPRGRTSRASGERTLAQPRGLYPGGDGERRRGTRTAPSRTDGTPLFRRHVAGWRRGLGSRCRRPLGEVPARASGSSQPAVVNARLARLG